MDFLAYYLFAAIGLDLKHINLKISTETHSSLCTFIYLCLHVEILLVRKSSVQVLSHHSELGQTPPAESDVPFGSVHGLIESPGESSDNHDQKCICPALTDAPVN